MRESRRLGKTLILSGVLLFGGAQAVTPVLDQNAVEFRQVMEHILRSYPSLQIAQLQVERAQQEIARVESQLGWSLSGHVGVMHDVSILGTPMDRADANLSLQRRLASGHSVGVRGNYTYEDSSFTFSPLFPNPSHATELDLNYRIPLRQGREHRAYFDSLTGADARIDIEQAARYALRNSLALQALELFHVLALTEVRLQNARLGVSNARRLQTYIAAQRELGLAEEKDSLQAEAQLRAQLTNEQQLLVALERQRISLNRLMGRDWEAALSSRLQTSSDLRDLPLAELIQQAEVVHPLILQNQARLRLTESLLSLSREQRKDVVDLVLSVGTRTRSGSSASGSISEEDWAGQIRLEYRESLDKQGLDAEVRQAQLERTIAIEDLRRVTDDLSYDLARLVRELQVTETALISARRHLDSERRKYDEAMQRYRQGRAETDRLIQYENELNAARLNVAQQEIELAQRVAQLEILHGIFWQGMELAEHTGN